MIYFQFSKIFSLWKDKNMKRHYTNCELPSVNLIISLRERCLNVVITCTLTFQEENHLRTNLLSSIWTFGGKINCFYFWTFLYVFGFKSRYLKRRKKTSYDGKELIYLSFILCLQLILESNSVWQHWQSKSSSMCYFNSVQ